MYNFDFEKPGSIADAVAALVQAAVAANAAHGDPTRTRA